MRHRAIPARPEKWTQQCPWLPQARSGSIPRIPTERGSDQGPPGSGEVTKNEFNPELLTQVVITQRRPSWYRMVGA